MDLAEKLRKEVASEHVAFTEFILKLKKQKTGLFCFFEGKDDSKYYGIRIKNVTRREYSGIICGNKVGVINLERLLSSKEEYKTIDKLYFIDKDYSEECSIENIYCLPSYSVENQYAKVSVLEEILTNEFNMNSQHADYDKVLNYFEKTRSEYHNNILLLNSWLSCQQKIREKTGINTSLNIDSKTSKYFSNPVNSDLNSIVDLSDLNSKENIEKLFSEAPKVKTEVLQKEYKRMKKSDYYSDFRGKFELRFFISFLSRLHSEIGKKASKVFEERCKCSLRFEYPNALSTLSIYAITPECLINYLESKKFQAA